MRKRNKISTAEALHKRQFIGDNREVEESVINAHAKLDENGLLTPITKKTHEQLAQELREKRAKAARAARRNNPQH